MSTFFDYHSGGGTETQLRWPEPILFLKLFNPVVTCTRLWAPACTHLNISLLHPQSGHSHDSQFLGGCSWLGGTPTQCSQRCQAKWDHFPHQMQHNIVPVHLFRNKKQVWISDTEKLCMSGSGFTVGEGSMPGNSPSGRNPSCLQTTDASLLSQRSSHTVPHTLPKQISTLPSISVWPPTRRTSPSVQFSGTTTYTERLRNSVL